MKNNTTLLYVIGGLLAGVLLTTCYFSFNSATRTRQMMGSYQVPQSNGMMHQMPDGTMMGGSNQMDMNSMMSGMMTGLNGKTGDEFDKAFLAEMIVHHQGAVVMAQAVLKNSKRPELIKLANDIITAQTGEITMMKNWQKAWFNIQN
jgi:uncharacterized protein (DUF305 family)